MWDFYWSLSVTAFKLASKKPKSRLGAVVAEPNIKRELNGAKTSY